MLKKGIWFLFAQLFLSVYSSRIRLVSPLNNGVGRIEVYYNGEWGTVCDDGFTDNSAKVACKQLGRYQPGFLPRAVTNFGFGTGRVWLDQVTCEGNESSLDECPHNSWGIENCVHDEDVGVICDERSVTMKLTPGYKAGLLQVYHNNVWGIVCDDDFDKVEATVVCRALGYDSGDVTDKNSSTTFWLDNVDCSMNDTDLRYCKHPGWGKHNCLSHEAVGIDCYSFSEGSSAARLVSSNNTPGEGRLELYYKGQWGTVCRTGMGSEEFTVVCRMLGYDRGGTGHSITPGSGNVLLEKVHCKGTETNINECAHSKWRQTTCSHSDDLSVRCFSALNIQQGIRLVSSTQGAGRVEILHNNVWGTVCKTGFTAKEARVVCRMANLPWSGAHVYSSYGQGIGVIWLSNVSCQGYENRLDQCSHSSWGSSTCSHSYDVGVICTEVRLSSGGSSTRGRLEIFYNNQWGTVCDIGFTNMSAKVACGMVGQSNKHAYHVRGIYDQGSGPVWLSNVQCRGSETSLGECSHSSWGSTSCSHSQDVGVVCSYPPEIHLDPNTAIINVNVGNNIVVECVVDDANPAVTSITWSHNGRSTTGKTFRIRNVSKSDHGTLSCTASNGLGMAPGRAQTAINVLYTPEVTLQPNVDVLKVFLGTNLTVKCDVNDANPSVTSITWSHIGRVSSGPSFYIENVTQADEGRLTCTAINEVGTSPGRADTYIRVLEGTPVRLSSGGSSTRGRLEIFYNNQWGTVCDIGFTNMSAKVACRMVGQSNKHAYHVRGIYGQGSGPVWLSNVQCRGSETSLGECSHSSWGNTSCSHSHDVGVVCSYPPKIHLDPNTTIINVSVGNDIFVECVVDDANPAVTSITWSHNGRSTTGKTFRIRNVSKSDNGTLSCTASNGLGMTPGRVQTAINVLVGKETKEVSSRDAVSNWTMIHTAAVVTGVVAFLIIVILVVVVIHLFRKLGPASAPGLRNSNPELTTRASNPLYDQELTTAASGTNSSVYEKLNFEPKKQQRDTKGSEVTYENIVLGANNTTSSAEVIYENTTA